MAVELSVLKCHGSWNEFVLVDAHRQIGVAGAVPSTADIQSICDRSGLVGADGLLFLGRDAEQRPELRVFNANGGQAEISGNGLRCAGRYLCDQLDADRCMVVVHGRPLQIARAETLADGVPAIRAQVDGIRILGKLAVKVPLPGGDNLGGDTRSVEVIGTRVEAPNPHIILFKEDLDGPALAGWSQCRLPDGALASERFNVSLAQRLEKAVYHLTTFERGVGHTPSCGSATCSLAAILLRKGYSQPGDDLVVHSDGGLLRCRAHEAVPLGGASPGAVSVILTGNATYIWSARLRFSDGGLSIAENSKRTFVSEAQAYGIFLKNLRDELWTHYHIPPVNLERAR